jgi:hypothetical protein
MKIRNDSLLLVLVAGLSGVVSASCGGSSSVEETSDSSSAGGASGGSGASAGGSSSTAGGATGAGAGTAAGGQAGASGLPCEISALLNSYCSACHGNPPSGGAPESLLSYEQMTMQVPKLGKTFAQYSLERMKAMAGPMPPKPADAVPADQIALFEAWVNAGTPATGCATGAGGAAGAGSGAGGAAGSVTNPYDTPVMCTTGSTWKGGNSESPDMHPGVACIDCHKKNNGPTLFFGGTAYPSAHEPDDCNGVTTALGLTGAVVEVTDANGTVYKLPVSPFSGNFSLRPKKGQAAPVGPFVAKITQGGKERVMTTPASSGDCNACHTEAGTTIDQGGASAPGRIMLP